MCILIFCEEIRIHIVFPGNVWSPRELEWRPHTETMRSNVKMDRTGWGMIWEGEVCGIRNRNKKTRVFLEKRFDLSRRAK